MKQASSCVISNTEITPGVYLMWLESPEIASAANPGQFVMVRCSDGYDPLLRRPLSVHRAGRVAGSRRAANALALLFRIKGPGTRWLGRRRAGEMVDLVGPLGRGFALGRDVHNLLLVAGGMGIAPLVALAEDAVALDRSVTIIAGAASDVDLYPGRLLPPEVELVTVTEDGSSGRQGLVTDILPEYLGWSDEVFACGPAEMYGSIVGLQKRLGSRKPVQVCFEEHMGCGLGACLGCVVETRRGPKRACKDGPVFYLTDLVL